MNNNFTSAQEKQISECFSSYAIIIFSNIDHIF